MLSNILPAPQQTYTSVFASRENFAPENVFRAQEVAIAKLNANVAPYGARSDYIPREPRDYGDGGAFPELAFKQYPLDMGRQQSMNKSVSSKTVSLKTDINGNIQYDAILRQGMRNDQILLSQYKDLAPNDDIVEEELLRPTNTEVEQQTAKTKQALEKIIGSKLSSNSARNNATNASVNSATNAPIFIRYTSGKANSTSSNSFNSGAKSRMIKLYSMPVDPLEPPKFRHKKLPARPPSPPVPIMHSPPRKVTIEDQKNWKIPPCASNWKNPRGYTLPLHQRLAADGRSLQNHVINDGFARFSEALLIAERQARKEVEARAQMRAMMAKKEKMETEKQLETMAKNIKQKQKHIDPKKQRNTFVETDTNTDTNTDSHQITSPSVSNSDSDSRSNSDSDSASASASDSDAARQEQEQERDRLRRERLRDNTREYRQSQRRKTGTNSNSHSGHRQRERDISEKIALGQLNGKKSLDGVYDRRLFNQESGLQSGFHADDSYHLYDRPLFNAKSQRIYRPKPIADYQISQSQNSNLSKFEFEQDTQNKNQYTEDKDTHTDKDIEDRDTFSSMKKKKKHNHNHNNTTSDTETDIESRNQNQNNNRNDNHSHSHSSNQHQKRNSEHDELSQLINDTSTSNANSNKRRRLEKRIGSNSSFMHASGPSALMFQNKDTKKIVHDHIWKKRGRIAFEESTQENMNDKVKGGIQYRNNTSRDTSTSTSTRRRHQGPHKHKHRHRSDRSRTVRERERGRWGDRN